MKRAIIDLSSVIWTKLLGGKDVELGRKVMHNEKEVFINSAQYGYDESMEFMVEVMDDLKITPRQIIFVQEGKNSKADRQSIHPLYKAGRDKTPEQYEEFNKAKEMLLQAFLDVGSQVCWQDGGVEADDVIGYLMNVLHGHRIAVSGDKDVAVTVDPESGKEHYRAGVMNENPFGDFPHKWITTYIALVGDSGDKIPGAKGFGKKSADLMLMAFGVDGLELMDGLIRGKNLLRLQEDVGTLRELQRVIDDAEGVYMSYELARLRTERVNTMRRPLQWRAGMVKPRSTCFEEALRKHAGVNRIVSAENYEEAMAWAKKQIAISPEVALDVETSTPPESDEWLAQREKEDRLDVFGSELTSLQMTFGPNMQYTFYLPVDNVEVEGCTNLTVQQVADFVDLVPRTKVMLIQNVAFELPICYMSWGELWAEDPEFHGFLRNVRDTKIMSSYVDENKSNGLKENSKLLLGYDQVSYESVTTRDELRADWNGVGAVVQSYFEPILRDTGEMEEVVTGYSEMVAEGTFRDDGEPSMVSVPIKKQIPKMEHVGDVEHVVVQRKMNQLTAAEVFDYGCDDTICTAAVGNHYRTIMEIEGSWHVFEEVETHPAYLTALAYVQGTAFSLASMAEQEKDDNEAFNKAEPVLLDYLMKIGFEGTRFEPITELDAASIKRAVMELHGVEILDAKGSVTKVRTPLKLAKLIEEQLPDSTLPYLIQENAVVLVNEKMKATFTGNPNLDLSSPKQMKSLLYGHMKLPVCLINDITPTEKAKQPLLDQAVRKFKAIRAGKQSGSMTDDEMALMRQKAKTDDDAVAWALKFNVTDEDMRAALNAIVTMKQVMTRRSLFYANYWKGLHWKDGKLHCNTNQCAAVSRRYSMSDQNLGQLPKKGEGVRFRSHFTPHKKNAVIASIDFVGQELRLAADTSQDENLQACYVGEDLKDPHSLTSAGALKAAWGVEEVNRLFDEFGADLRRDKDGTYLLFLRLLVLPKGHPVRKKAEDHRKGAKNTNFAAQNGARAVKVSEMNTMPLVEAQQFLDGREVMFPGVSKAADKCAEDAKRVGYATTYMGVRRHLRDAMTSDERGAADRAGRQAWSTRIQASAAEMTKLGMGRLWRSGVYFRYDARFIAPIHDELVSSVSREHAVDFLREKNAAMTVPYSTMKVPILGSISIGPNFAEQIECGNTFVQANIENALNDIFAVKEAA
jgi:5'-3' exonuclease